MTSTQPEVSRAEVIGWLTQRIAFYVERRPEEIDPGTDLTSYGMDSLRALTLSAAIEDEYGLELDEGLAWDHRTVDALATFLMDQFTCRT